MSVVLLLAQACVGDDVGAGTATETGTTATTGLDSTDGGDGADSTGCACGRQQRRHWWRPQDPRILPTYMDDPGTAFRAHGPQSGAADLPALSRSATTRLKERYGGAIV